MVDANAGFLVGLIGDGIGASLSPALHEQEAAAQGMRYFYKLIDLAGAQQRTSQAEALEAAEALGFAGCNVTHPYKQSVLDHLDELSEEAEALGAVNTVVFAGGKRIGHNTDWYGFAEGLRGHLPTTALNCVGVLGAGGAGSAVTYALLKLGAGQVAVCDLDREKAHGLVRRLSPLFAESRLEVVVDVETLLRDADGFVHATPTGMFGHPGLAVPQGLLRRGLWVADVVYTLLETELLAVAKSNGCRTLSGGAMAVHQAARAFELFTGRPADAARMQRHFDLLQASS